MITPANYREILTSIYRENPCQVLPNANWKSLSWLETFEVNLKLEGSIISQLVIRNTDQLMMYWERCRCKPDRNLTTWIDSANFALLHDDFKAFITPGNYRQQDPYFRLIHKMENIPKAVLPRMYSFVQADPVKEAQVIAGLIADCYEDIQPSSDEVLNWCEYPVFEDDLWVWIINEGNQSPVGLGIAQFDRSIKEGSLEWIQVVPSARRQGLGKQIVYELLSRLKGKAEFVTVAGKINDRSQPEKLYRSCGFEGKDIWWVLRK